MVPFERVKLRLEHQIGIALAKLTLLASPLTATLVKLYEFIDLLAFFLPSSTNPIYDFIVTLVTNRSPARPQAC